MVIKCPKCDTDNPSDSKYCKECATPLPSKKEIPVTETLEIPTEELTAGSTFAGRYQIIEELGKGGMGKVYKVLDNKINEKIALKLIKPEIASDKKTVKRFNNELKFARKIRHKNVCQMFDLGEDKGTHFITMEYVHGENLKQLIRRMGNLSAEQAITITKQVCKGLSEAHRTGIVHRDLKPQNIMVDEEGNARIMDFGIARSIEAKGVTEAGMIVGTPDYMSPEQVDGKEADQRSDIYSMGVILYEMLTGRTPFQGDTALSIAVKHKTEMPQDPRELNDQVSGEISHWILKCMEKDREKRYQSAEEFLSELSLTEKGIAPAADHEKPQIPAFLFESEEKLAVEERSLFVAREKELDKLGKFFDRAISGKGQVVFVTGEAGNGKTALITEFARRAQEKHPNLIVASGNCNANTGIGDPYLPFYEVLSLITGDVETKWEAGSITREHATCLWNLLPLSVQALVDNGPDLIDTFVSGAALVSRAVAFKPDKTPWLRQLKKLVERKANIPATATPHQNVLFEQYTRVLQALARQQPSLLVLDDLQWADSGSISLLFHLGRRIRGTSIMIVGAFRPDEVALGRSGERHPLEPVLNEFKREFGDFELAVGKAESREFVDAFLDAEPNRLGTSFRDTLYKQTKGHPLFTVELLRDMQEGGVLVRDKEDKWVEGAELNWDALPARVDAVIEGRIGRLTEKLRELLTLASVEGEEFTAEVMARLQETEVQKLIRVLSSELDKQHHLVSAKGIRQIDRQRLSLYIFQHILFQRYLYNSLDEVERSHLHEQVGNVLETLYGEQAEEISVQLARHFEESGIKVKAVEYLHKAGNKAVRLSANKEAIVHFSKGLELLKSLPDTPERARKELELLLGIGVPLLATKGYGAPEAGHVYKRAQDLCQQIGEVPLLVNTLFSLSTFHRFRAEYKQALELADQLLSLAERTEDPQLLAVAHQMRGENLISIGEFAQARDQLEHMIAFYDPQKHRSLAFIFGQDPGVNALMWSALALGFLGYLDQAWMRYKEALALAKDLDHPFTLALARAYGCCIAHLFLRDAQVAKEHSEIVVSLSAEQRFGFVQAFGTIYKGWVQAEEGKIEEGISLMRKGLDGMKAAGTNFYRPRLLGLLAEAYGKAGQTEEGLKVLSEAFALVEKTGEHFYEGEMVRLKGELLQKKGESESEAEESFRQAINISRQRSTKLFELRAVVSLSRLLLKQGKKEEPRKMLSEIYGWFTEGFDTPDLKEAKALLEELS